MRVHDVEPRTPPWCDLRRPRVGSTDAKAVTSTRRNGAETAARRDLRTRIALSRLDVQIEDPMFSNADTERGIRLEPIAIRYLELSRSMRISPVGYVSHDTLYAGVSPDGHIDGTAGAVEIKAPRPSNQVSAFRLADAHTGLEAVPAPYRMQLVHHLCVDTSRAYVIWASFCEEMPPPLQLLTHTIKRESIPDQLSEYTEALTGFCGEVDQEIAILSSLIKRQSV